MTVQQERPTTARALVSPALPRQRTADHDRDGLCPPPHAAPPPRGWATAEDRTTCRWLMVGMLVLGLYASLMVTLGARVFG